MHAKCLLPIVYVTYVCRSRADELTGFFSVILQNGPQLFFCNVTVGLKTLKGPPVLKVADAGFSDVLGRIEAVLSY